MKKLRIFKFSDGKEINESVESLSFKKAVKSMQNKIDLKKHKGLFCEWITKRGQEMSKWIKMPIGRKKKISR